MAAPLSAGRPFACIKYFIQELNLTLKFFEFSLMLSELSWPQCGGETAAIVDKWGGVGQGGGRDG